jgi:hypothetical protein
VGQRDYLLRMIEQAGRILVELRRMILGGDLGPGEAEAELESVATRAGLDLDLLRSVNLETLVLLISPGGEPEAGRCWITAELFGVDGHRALAEGDVDGARDRWARALRLYALLDPGIVARGFPEVRQRVAEIRESLAALDRGPDPV